MRVVSATTASKLGNDNQLGCLVDPVKPFPNADDRTPSGGDKGDRTPDLVNAMKEVLNDHAMLQREMFRSARITVEESAERSNWKPTGSQIYTRSTVGHLFNSSVRCDPYVVEIRGIEPLTS